MRYTVISLGGRHILKWRMLMSEKVKSITYEMADPEHLGFITKRTDLLDVVTKI